MYFNLQLVLLIPLLLSLTEARPQKKIKSTTEAQSLSSSERHQKRTRIPADKSHGKIFKGWQKGNEKTGSRYYLVKANSNGTVVVFIFCFIISVSVARPVTTFLRTCQTSSGKSGLLHPTWQPLQIRPSSSVSWRLSSLFSWHSSPSLSHISAILLSVS